MAGKDEEETEVAASELETPPNRTRNFYLPACLPACPPARRHFHCGAPAK